MSEFWISLANMWYFFYYTSADESTLRFGILENKEWWIIPLLLDLGILMSSTHLDLKPLPHSYKDWDKFDPFEFDNGFRRWKSGRIGWEDLMFEWSSRDAVVLVALFTHHPTSDLQNLLEIYSFKDFVFKVLGFVDFFKIFYL